MTHGVVGAIVWYSFFLSTRWRCYCVFEHQSEHRFWPQSPHCSTARKVRCSLMLSGMYVWICVLLPFFMVATCMNKGIGNDSGSAFHWGEWSLVSC